MSDQVLAVGGFFLIFCVLVAWGVAFVLGWIPRPPHE
jgi:hypothetical protein